MTRPASPPDERPRNPSSAYEVLRRGGALPESARVQLNLTRTSAARLEAVFLTRAGRGADEAQPRFARHEAHVAAVLAHGGFPALSERRFGRSGVTTCLPLLTPQSGARHDH